MPRRASLFAVAVAASSDPAAAFAPSIKALARPASVAVRLVPEQGRQLVAFSQDYHAKKAKESASKASHLTHASPRRAPRRRYGAIGSLVTRLLHREGTPRRDQLAESMEEELDPTRHDHHEVLYPIIGFTLVDGRAVPSPGQTPARALREETGEELLFGYCSPHGGDGLWM